MAQETFEMVGSSRETLWTDPTVKVITSGEPFRRWLGVLRCLVDEAKLHFTEDGIHVKAVDPANVGMVELDWNQHGMGVYNHHAREEILLGLNLKTLDKFASFARIPQDDPLSLYIAPRDPDESLGDVDFNHLGSRITRPDQRVQRSTVMWTIDPDSIRQEPDLETDFEQHVAEATVRADGFSAAVQALNKTDDHAEFTVNGETLVMSAGSAGDEGKFGDDVFNFPSTVAPIGDEDPDGIRSLYSMDYLKDMAGRLKTLGIEDISIRLGDEFPIRLGFDHEEWNIKGGYLLAPRIQSD